MTHLRGISLNATQISNAGLVHLEGLTKLTYLDLSKPQVTDAGGTKLQKALPNCRINH